MNRSNAHRDLPLRGDRCRCAACGEFFNSTAAFDAHRTGKPAARRCLSVDEMLARGMAQNEAGYWTSGAFPEAAIAALKADRKAA